MHISTYLELSSRTEKKFPDGMALSQNRAELLHAALGVAGEAGEIAEAFLQSYQGMPLDVINLGEEAGDFGWFLAALSRLNHISAEVIETEIAQGYKAAPSSLEVAGQQLCAASGRIVDLIKKDVIYGKQLDSAVLVVEILSAWHQLGTFICAICMDPDRVFEANIAKLAKRFGDKYSDTAANFRDLSAEREHLSDAFAT
jgi:NTP pyrophosphatase (non-canonical NTP hydrolase)